MQVFPCALRLAGLLAFSTLFASSAMATSACSMELLEHNMSLASAVKPSEQNVYISLDQRQLIQTERRIPCTSADLLELGFEIKASQQRGPRDSNSGGYEDMVVMQKGKLAVTCYSEFGVQGKGKQSKMTSAMLVCSQLVQPSLVPKAP